MSLRRPKVKRPSHNVVIDAVTRAVVSASESCPPGTYFNLKVADLPEVGQSFDAYDLDRVAARLDRLRIVVKVMHIESDWFYFRSPGP